MVLELKAPALTQALPQAPRDVKDERAVERHLRATVSSLEKMRLDLASSIQNTQAKLREVETAVGSISSTQLYFGPAAARPGTLPAAGMYIETNGEHRIWLWTGTAWVLTAARLAWTAS